MKLISEFNDYAVAPVIVEENEKGEKEYFIEGRGRKYIQLTGIRRRCRMITSFDWKL